MKTLLLPKFVAAIFLWSCLTAYVHAQATVETLETIPSEGVVLNVGTDEGVMEAQCRNFAGLDDEFNNFVGIGQSFVWDSDKKLEGIGIYVRPKQSEFLWPDDAEQKYVIYLHSGDGATLAAGSHQEIARYEVMLNRNHINYGGEWLYFRFPPVPLKRLGWYGFQIFPAVDDPQSGLRAFFQISDTDYEGNSMSINAKLLAGQVPYDGTFSNNAGGIKDFTFFLKATD